MAQKYVQIGDANGVPFKPFTIDSNGNAVCENVTEIQVPYLFSYAKYKYSLDDVTSVSFPKLTTISGRYAMDYAFYDCTSLTSLNFPKLTTISGSEAMGHAFYFCTHLTSVSFPKLTTISNGYVMRYAFYYCTNLTSVSFPELTTISGNYVMDSIFRDCKNLTSVSFPKLTTVTCPTTAFDQAGSSTLTIHFPKALSSLGITNYLGSNSSDYCKFVYDL